ncbi:MAG TPA: hypothetical protein VFQ53_06490 [Kofleriaceae bacterium]|nr:hypothetical protein [Kofleriaceae bacterium]
MTRRRLLALALVWTLPSVVFLAVTAIVFAAYRIPPPDRLDDTTRASAIAAIRSALDEKPALDGALSRMPLDGPIVVTVWAGGRPLARVLDTSPTLGEALRVVQNKLATQPIVRGVAKVDRDKARIQIDLVTGTAPLGSQHWLVESLGAPGVGDMMAINSGVEGVGATIDGKPYLLLPHELVGSRLLAAKKPSAALGDFAMGVDLDRISTVLASQAGVKTKLARDQLYRFRTDTFVERPFDQRPQPPLELYRGIPAAPKISGKVLRDAALAGGRYLVAHLAPNGRYIYEHDLSTGSQTDPRGPSYSMPRHAGTTYFLAELYRITKEPWLREPIERAFAHLAELMANGKCTGKLPDGTEIDCVMDRTERVAALGSTALAVVALAEYQRATGDTRYLPSATKLAAWILWMQRPDGSFRHRYDPVTKRPDDKAQDLYYSGEAALALVRMHVITGDPKYARAAERALDWLVDWYDFFMGGFFYGEEHWTCIAAEAAFPAIQKPAYRDFCHGYGAFLREQQASVGDHPDEDDLAGAYGFTPFIVPYNTPAGSRTEAMISAYLLGKHHGTPDPAVRGQIEAALGYVIGQQIRPETEFAVVGPGLGGVPGSPIDRNVRIDFVQHVCSAFIRASQFIDEP